MKSQISQIKELLEHEWADSNQEIAGMLQSDYNYNKIKSKLDYIRYLQDQINKIIGELNES